MDMLKACLDVSNAAIALFDLIEAEGIDAPLEDIEHAKKLVAVIDKTRDINEYYQHRAIQRMLALGVSPGHLIERIKQ